MEYLIGIALAAAVGLFARFTGLDRDRAFYPTVTIVISSYYGLYAIMGGSMRALGLEVIVIGFFVLAAVLGFRRNLWYAAAALFLHGVTDFFHGDVIANPGTPAWWPGFCGAYDVTAAAGLAWLIRRGQPAAAR